MWWAKDLELRRHEVERARRRLAAGMGGDEPVFATVRRTTPDRAGWTLADGLALAFAAASILGPLRAVRFALAAASAIRAARALTGARSSRR